MVIYILDNGKIIKDRDMEKKNIKMEKFTKESGKVIENMVNVK